MHLQRTDSAASVSERVLLDTGKIEEREGIKIVEKEEEKKKIETLESNSAEEEKNVENVKIVNSLKLSEMCESECKKSTSAEFGKNEKSNSAENKEEKRVKEIGCNYKQCLECSKIVLKKNYYLHLRVHSLLKPHMCDVCGMCFKYRRVLDGHRRTHTGEKPYLCNTCGKSFTTSSRLSQHASVHTGRKPHVCDICARAFRAKKDLDRHYRSHTGEKPYLCVFCGKGFPYSWSLREHTRRHTGELPYVCSFCKQAFKRSNILMVHERAMHPEAFALKSDCENGSIKSKRKSVLWPSKLPGTVSPEENGNGKQDVEWNTFQTKK